MPIFIFIFSYFILPHNLSAAQQDFNGKDFSGAYLCKGENSRIGTYEVTTNLVLDSTISQGDVGIYRVTVENSGLNILSGQAITVGKRLGVTLKLLGAKTMTSTGNAIIKSTDGSLSYSMNYIESDDTSNVLGNEECVLKVSTQKSDKTNSADTKSVQPIDKNKPQ